MFKKILIANRGEIAVRVIRTCREMGIETVSVYSDADGRALHAISSPQAVFIGDSDPLESYLNMDRIIAAARETGADAIHPGYGFLAENPDFAARCRDAGIVFIGPPPEVIMKLGNKAEARKIMLESGVPVVPGCDSGDPGIMMSEAEKTGYPVVIKAVAGGGGKGMRIVNSPEKFMESLKSASGEAESAFGNGSVYFEKYIETPRHIEFQVLADNHGNTIHLLERECSIQRRFQKIIEETPSPALDGRLRGEMGRAAVTAASASGYRNAGTVEFILDRDGNYYFLEVNTRIQVEHPVTEMVTGIDIVRKQIEIAAGKKLDLEQDSITGRGHAIECRIYAEDPRRGFVPCPGKIDFLREPLGPGVRVDSGIYGGYRVPYEYDPILSKLITHGSGRDENIVRMVNSLKEYIVLGIETPVEFLIDILESEAFRSGDINTGFIDEHFESWEPSRPDRHIACLAYVADLLLERKRPALTDVESREMSPWQTLGDWRI